MIIISLIIVIIMSDINNITYKETHPKLIIIVIIY